MMLIQLPSPNDIWRSVQRDLRDLVLDDLAYNFRSPNLAPTATVSMESPWSFGYADMMRRQQGHAQFMEIVRSDRGFNAQTDYQLLIQLFVLGEVAALRASEGSPSTLPKEFRFLRLGLVCRAMGIALDRESLRFPYLPLTFDHYTDMIMRDSMISGGHDSIALRAAQVNARRPGGRGSFLPKSIVGYHRTITFAQNWLCAKLRGQETPTWRLPYGLFLKPVWDAYMQYALSVGLTGVAPCMHCTAEKPQRLRCTVCGMYPGSVSDNAVTRKILPAELVYEPIPLLDFPTLPVPDLTIRVVLAENSEGQSPRSRSIFPQGGVTPSWLMTSSAINAEFLPNADAILAGELAEEEDDDYDSDEDYDDDEDDNDMEGE